ncbi:MAG: hypothetical protein KDA51_13040 [Planctomycetales bacterium]|nr:hypothetical protein [Planctomycetales bacterium]
MAGTKQAPLEAHRAHTALRLLTLAASKLSDDFSGLGIVFYDSLAELPFLPLEVSGSENFDLPVCGLNAVCDVLVRTARRSSHWHDGFHFVHAGSVSLTHLCQFIAPPLPDDGDDLPRASGARHMTALLASQVRGIVTVGLLTQEQVVSIYESGKLTLHKPLE